MTDHWQRLFQSWSKLRQPTQASAVVLDAVKSLVADAGGPVLLLGVTPGLRDAAADLTAIDQNEGLIRGLGWNTVAGRRAVVGDWLRMPFAAASFAACVGDGCLISCAYPERWTVALESVARGLRPGGLFACRVFLAPDTPATAAEIVAAARRGAFAAFEHFKFSLAMAQGASTGSPNIAVSSIADCFDRHVPDRDSFAVQTGWERAQVDTIDVYRGSHVVYAFPTAAQCLAAVPSAFGDRRLLYFPDHPMGAHWPILTLRVG